MCLNIKIPTGINTETIVVAANNLVLGKEGWGTHILVTLFQNALGEVLRCFTQIKGQHHNAGFFSLKNKKLKLDQTNVKQKKGSNNRQLGF